MEIQEFVCSDVTEGKDQCYSLHEEYDAEIEEWWFNKQTEKPNLFEHFCINTFKHCCPDLHYGPNCTPCQGYPDNICSNNGKCKGAGTRKGSGLCNCDLGYTGPQCDNCSDTHYISYKDDKKLLCSKCHISCSGPCTKAGPEGNKKCKDRVVLEKQKQAKYVTGRLNFVFQHPLLGGVGKIGFKYLNSLYFVFQRHPLFFQILVIQQLDYRLFRLYKRLGKK